MPTNDLPNPPTMQGAPVLIDPPAGPSLSTAHDRWTLVNPYDARATTILVLGIVGLVLFPPAGIAAWIMGSQLRKEANAAGYHEPGQSRAGRICGVIATIVTVAMLIGMVLFMVNRTSGHMNLS
jgi:hypothetical protein